MNETLMMILVCLLAGAGAGIGTGFAGMSAAAVIAPVLIAFLGYSQYDAVGVALASDVLASMVSAFIYHKHKNVNFHPEAIVLMSLIIVFTFVSSYLSKLVSSSVTGNGVMSYFSMGFMIVIGLKFLIFPSRKEQSEMNNISKIRKWLGAVLGGIYIGFVCGFIGAGGGMMMLFVLTAFLGYDTKTAVGTSVFIMSFTALTGSISHILMSTTDINWTVAILCIVFTFLFAQASSILSNKLKIVTMNRIVGAVLLSIGVMSFVLYFI